MESQRTITGKTKIIGVIGSPIEHSMSPQLHNSISKQLGIDMVYVPFCVEENELQDAVRGLKALNVVGFNVTIPHKENIIKYLDEISQEAILMGAVNTVKKTDGKLCGYNTDASGFMKSFTNQTKTTVSGKKVAIIGAGGTARSLAVKIALEGACEISIVNRTLGKAENIANILNNNFTNFTQALLLYSSEGVTALSKADIIINTTPLGMYPNIDFMPLSSDFTFSKQQIIFDVIYNPKKTKLLKLAEEQGCTIVNGLGMLIFQGILAYEIWTGLEVPNIFANKIQNTLLA